MTKKKAETKKKTIPIRVVEDINEELPVEKEVVYNNADGQFYIGIEQEMK